MSMITATAWVRRGIAAPFPIKYDFNEEEFKRIAELAKLNLDDAIEDLEESHQDVDGSLVTEVEEPNGLDADDTGIKSDLEVDDDDLKEYDLEHYDDDNDEETKASETGMRMFGNLKSLVYYESNADDPYITIPENEEDDEDRDELQILATDNLVLAAKVEDDVAHLEVYVYEDDADNLYVHHDIMLPAIPLCVEWLDLPVGRTVAEDNSKANFVAVGTFDPEIEIWDLDTIDCMYPNAILGEERDSSNVGNKKKDRKKKKKSKKSNDNFHVDAVLSLAANRQHRNLLASSSADKTVKLWDLNTAKCAKSYSNHTDKVCSIQWHPVDSTVLLSGSYDRTVIVADMRAPEAKKPTWGVESDVEMVKWDPHDSNFFYISTEGGIVHYHDIRKAPSNPAATKPIWILQAHDESVSAFDINPIIPGFMATGSSDKYVKLWNIHPSGPSMVVSRDLDVGKVFSTSFAPDEEVGFRLAVAGSKGLLHIWDTSTNSAVRSAFAGKITFGEGTVKEKLVGIEESHSDDSDDGLDNDEEEEESKTRNVVDQGWESMDED
ncbi:putative WD repeat-containing protein C17D11.16 [Golovinomyces cichoracearum]|uniref:Putative WD repeat-containing protein C17D11.16 n=1 Tax=Golovinomyces cichoracearum TaxID=62708 RepID=A0A420IH93_9PEZI|nr:putative WD repeat-containing protein C17D11.16 [Golovinomyces cichoracearum]